MSDQHAGQEPEEYLTTRVRWRREGTGPPWHRVGRAVRYRAAEVDRWVEENSHG
jgi:predicted DNA-binding transcriptional regulator AlpA